MPTAAKVLLGAGLAGGTGLAGGAALGAIGEQAKDDLISGRDMRKQQEMMRKQQRMQQRMAMRGM